MQYFKKIFKKVLTFVLKDVIIVKLLFEAVRKSKQKNKIF